MRFALAATLLVLTVVVGVASPASAAVATRPVITGGGSLVRPGVTVDYLVVGGGGAGGNSGGGGGGAGGLLSGSTSFGTGSVSVTVGSGGLGCSGFICQGGSGTGSAFGSVVTSGGGGGGSNNIGGLNGGSGGGGGVNQTTGGTGIFGQGNAGGAGANAGIYGAAGGGGAGGTGGNGSVSAAGNGGGGVASSITGSPVTYAGGGGGGCYLGATCGGGGLGGAGGGGTGGRGVTDQACNTPPTAGTANTGGGGGGNCNNTLSPGSANGGSGVVIVRYPGVPLASGGTVTEAGGFTIHRFTSSGTLTRLPYGSVDLNFTQGSDGGATITNYAYSLAGGAFTPLSPADATSPVTIPGVTSGQVIRLKAVNASGNSSQSNGAMVDTSTLSAVLVANTTPVAANKTLSAHGGVGASVTLSGTDADGDDLSFQVVAQPSKGSVVCGGTTGQDCVYTATLGQTGSDSFTYVANDATALSSAATVSITIVNQAPVATGSTRNVQRGASIIFNLIGSDPDSDTIDGSVVGTGYTKLTDPAVGTLSCSAAGACTYSVPSGTAPGTYSFTWNVKDASSTSNTATETLVVGNTVPTVSSFTVNDVQRGRPAADEPFDLQGTDANGDSLTYSVIATPSVGTLSCTSAGACTYAVPAETAVANVTFTYQASDGVGSSNTGTVTLGVANTTPVANNVGPITTTVGSPVAVALNGTDFNSNVLTYAAPVAAPGKGSVSGTGASRTYTPNAGTKGADSFTYTVTDIGGLTSTSTVTVNLDNVTPGVFVGATDFVEPESGNATYRSPFIPVMLSTPAAAPVTVWYYTVDGTAVTTGLDGDYRQWGTPSSPRSITIPAGQSTGWIQPPVFDDNVVENTEQFSVVISSLSGGASYLGEATTTVDIIDADTLSVGKPIVSVVDIDQAEGNVGTRVAGFRILMSKAATVPVTFTCTPVAGTAVAGTDFRAGAKTVTIPAGGLSKSVDILVYSNTVAQADRSFTLSCTVAGTPDITIYQSTATATLHDDD